VTAARLTDTGSTNTAVTAEDFARLTEPYRAELLAHCYRMLGSVHDAEDQVQETLVRAWRSFDRFEGRSSLRTWLYRIATNACLRAIETRRRRPLPSGLGAPAEPGTRPGPANPELGWLEPIPDALFTAQPADPAQVAVSRSSMRLALVAALQYLPGRQRAVLILRDVLGWSAAEVADLLGVTTVAVNSLLQRARSAVGRAAPAESEIREPDRGRERALLDRYAAAFEAADVTGLLRLLRADAGFEMPPQPAWFTGRAAIGRFLDDLVLTRPGRFRLRPAAANGQPALAGYQRDADGVYRAHGIQVITVTGPLISHVVSFNDPGLFAVFGLPPVLDQAG